MPLEYFGSILEALDRFVSRLPEQLSLEKELLLWPGTWTTTTKTQMSSRPVAQQNLTVIHRADFENHNKDGGLWLIIGGKVYDIQDFKSVAPCGGQVLLRWAGLDATEAFASAGHSESAQALLSTFCVGMMEQQQHLPADDGTTAKEPSVFSLFNSVSSTSALDK